MSGRFSLESILTLTDRLTGPMKRATSNVTASSRQMEKSFGSVNSAAGGLSVGTLMKGFVGGQIAMRAIDEVIELGREGLKMASDLVEVQNVVDTTFGGMSKSIDKWAKSAAVNYGISELQAKQFTGSIGAMMKSSGIAGDELVKMSTGLSGLAGDFASFYNLDVAEAFDKIRSGISGETEPLKRLGINMSVANMQAFALSQGIHKQWTKMTQSEQTLLRYNYLMKVSNDAQGDFAKTLSTSAANQARVLEMQKKAAAANVMKTFLPMQLRLYKMLNAVLSDFPAETFANAVIGIAGAFALWKIATWGVIAANGVMMAAGWVQYLWQMRSAIMATVEMQRLAGIATKIWTAAQWMFNAALNVCGIFLLVAIIAAIVIGVIAMYENWDTVVQKIKEAVQWFRELLHLEGSQSDKNDIDRRAGIQARSKAAESAETPEQRAARLEYAKTGQWPAWYQNPNTKGATTSKSSTAIDVNFNNTPKGTTIKQTGRTAPGTTVAVGAN